MITDSTPIFKCIQRTWLGKSFIAGAFIKIFDIRFAVCVITSC
jgi:hypothetical protein